MEKTLSLLLIIGLGLVLQRKIKSQDHLKGVKVLILSVALPATIFAALLSVEVEADMLLLPLIAFMVNLVLLGAFYAVLKYIMPVEGNKRRTMLMLMPSLAPGLSCFPFISEYLGSSPLAMAALADVGNKVFVLVLLYLLAMHWYYRRNQVRATSKESRLKALLISLAGEPINMVILAAFVLLAFGINMETIPTVFSTSISRMAAMMAPLVLLFIGIAVKIRKGDLGFIFRMLSLLSGLAFLFSSGLMVIFPGLTSAMILLLLVFAQSSASFWPYAHISVVSDMEGDNDTRTFDAGLALSVLALSLPFSTFIILGILSFPVMALSPVYPAMIGVFLVIGFLLTPLISWVKRLKSMKREGLDVSQNTPYLEENLAR